MSSYNDDKVKCPGCGSSPILASDVGSHYIYVCTNREGCAFETTDYDKLIKVNPQPSPPTPRPDVDKMKRQASDWVEKRYPNIKHWGGLMHDMSVLCDYTLDVEKRLADLVKAGKKHGVSHWSWCRKSENTGVSCTCGFVEIAAALIAAEQQLGESEGKP